MPTPDEVRAILDKHRWKPGEREAMTLDIVERQAVPEATHSGAGMSDVVIHKQRPIEAAQSEAVMRPTDAWVDYIKRQLDKRERAMSGAIADLLGPIEKNHKAALDELRGEMATLKSEVAELRGELKTRAALADMEARLLRMETTPTTARLKTVS